MIQPSDETPLPDLSGPDMLESLHPSYVTARDELDSVLGDFYEATADAAATVDTPLANAQRDVGREVATVAGSMDNALDDATGRVGKAVKRIDAAADKPLTAIEDKLAAEGVKLPYFHAERRAALDDDTGATTFNNVLPAVQAALGIEVLARPGDERELAVHDPIPVNGGGSEPYNTPPTAPAPPMPPAPGPVQPMPPLQPPVQPIAINTTTGTVGVPPPTFPPPVTFPPQPQPPLTVPWPYPPPPPVTVPPSPPFVPPPSPPVPGGQTMTFPAGCPPTTITVMCGTCGAATTAPVPPPPGVPPGTSPPGPSTSPPPPGEPGEEPLPPGQGGPLELQAGSVTQWGYANDCASADATCKKAIVPITRQPAPGQPEPPKSLAGYFGQFVNGVSGVIGSIAGELTDIKVDWETVKRTLVTGGGWVFPDYLPNPELAAYYSGLVAQAAWMERITGGPFTYLSTWATYQLQYCNPLNMPGQTDADAMFARGYVNQSEWECLTKLNGNVVPWHQMARNAKGQFPNVSEITQLYMRGEIKSKEDYHRRIREAGTYLPIYADEWLKLAQQIPPSGDLVRFMVRDSADEDVVKKYQYDFEFADKFKGKIEDWAKAQGIDAEYMKYIWRSHWEIPSNTQLYDMLHRLRPDRYEVEAWLKINPEFTIADVDSPNWKGPPVVTPEMVRDALQVNDNAPGWINRLMEISYHPITNTDARRAFMLGDFDQSDLHSSMLNNGYAPRDADTLVHFFQAEKDKTLSIQSGVLSIRKIVRFYKDGAINALEFNTQLMPLIPDERTRMQLFDRVSLEMEAETRSMCIKAIKKRYLYGEFNHAEAEIELLQLGVPSERVTGMMMYWNCEKSNRQKEPRVQMICTWYTNGYITGEQYITRLMNLGYQEVDAYRIAASCWKAEMEKRWKAQIAEQEKLIKEWQRLAREEKGDYRQAIKDAKDRIKEIKKLQAEREKQLKEQSDAPPAPEEEPHGPIR